MIWLFSNSMMTSRERLWTTLSNQCKWNINLYRWETRWHSLREVPLSRKFLKACNVKQLLYLTTTFKALLVHCSNIYLLKLILWWVIHRLWLLHLKFSDRWLSERTSTFQKEDHYSLESLWHLSSTTLPTICSWKISQILLVDVSIIFWNIFLEPQLEMKVMFMQGLKNVLKGSLSNMILGDVGGFSY